MVERKTPVESARRAVECLVHDFLEAMEARDSSRTAMFDQLVGLVCNQRAAAIEAAKQSGVLHLSDYSNIDPDYFAPTMLKPAQPTGHVWKDFGACGKSCQVCGVDSQDGQGAMSCFGQPTPPTENKDEREELDDLLCVALELSHIGGPAKRAQAIRDHILAERSAVSDAADKAGYERGFQGGQDAVDDAVQAREDLAREHECSMQGLACRDSLRAELTQLQSQHKRLTAAARAWLAWWDLEDESLAVPKGVIESVRTALAETLSETEEKKT